MRTAAIAFVALGLAGCSSLTPTTDPVYLRITDIEARLIRIERVLDNESLISLAGDITSLRTEVQQLLGEVETLQFELDGQSERQLDLYVDLDDRLAALEEAQSQMAQIPVPTAGGSQLVSMTDQQAYDAALGMLERQDWANAEQALDAFLLNYPRSTLRANAQYWLAESFYSRLDFRQALAEFQQVLNEYPDSNKVPDALLKIGYSHYEMQNRDRARQALLRVVREYPDSDAARLAEGRLQLIAQETG